MSLIAKMADTAQRTYLSQRSAVQALAQALHKHVLEGRRQKTEGKRSISTLTHSGPRARGKRIYYEKYVVALAFRGIIHAVAVIIEFPKRI